MLDDNEERIKTEAYRRWEQEGRPHGAHDRHWQEAAKALENGDASAIVESEGTTQALKAPKAAKPKASKAAVKPAGKPAAKAAEPVVEIAKRTRAKKAPAE